MAVERVKLLNIVLPKAETYPLLQYLLLKERVQFVDARKMIDETSFLLSAEVENAAKIQELNNVQAFVLPPEVAQQMQDLGAVLREVEQQTGIKAAFQAEAAQQFTAYFDLDPGIAMLETALKAKLDGIAKLDQELLALQPYEQIAAAGLDFPLGKLFNMQNFATRLGWIDKVAADRLSRNAGEIPPLYFKLAAEKDKELCFFIYPHELATESDRVVRSLRLEEIELAQEFRELDLGAGLSELLAQKRAAKSKLQEDLVVWAKTNKPLLDAMHSRLQLEQTIAQALGNVGATEHYAFISLWTAATSVGRLVAEVEQQRQGNCLVLSSNEAKVYEQAPTSLRNNRLFRPFEQLIAMYGTPAYKELDPTPFFALVYMLLFGVMFGDVGQGLVFVLAGFWLKRKQKQSSGAGGILQRIGAASMCAGFIYDSFFGYEGVISQLIPLPIYLHPFTNTNVMLGFAVGLGVLLLSLAYVFGIINKLRLGEWMEAFLGKEGLTGFVLYLAILSLIPSWAGYPLLPKAIPLLLIALAASLLVFHEPLYHLLTGQRPLYKTKASDYYVENGFNIFDAFLAVLSNTLSFIRVGAFALNHVGLFLAFHTLAKMLNSTAGSIAMGVIGNVVIIGLEGLIVFIQGLRLMYYELFSKFFKGGGIEFQPLSLKEE